MTQSEVMTHKQTTQNLGGDRVFFKCHPRIPPANYPKDSVQQSINVTDMSQNLTFPYQSVYRKPRKFNISEKSINENVSQNVTEMENRTNLHPGRCRTIPRGVFALSKLLIRYCEFGTPILIILNLERTEPGINRGIGVFISSRTKRIESPLFPPDSSHIIERELKSFFCPDSHCNTMQRCNGGVHFIKVIRGATRKTVAATRGDVAGNARS